MGYKLLGWATWKGATWYLRHKFGRTAVPVPLLAGAVVLAALGVALGAKRKGLPGQSPD